MNTKIEKVCFVIDSPMNALIASLIACEAAHVEIIYALDPQRKDIAEYMRVSRALLSSLKIASELVIEFDSLRFWGGGKNEMLPTTLQALTPLVKEHPRETVYFGNCLTNPVALALKRLVKINHLYHAPGDFTSILFPTGNKYTRSCKRVLKKIIGIPLYEIENDRFPFYSLVEFSRVSSNKCLDYMEFSSEVVKNVLVPLILEMRERENVIMLLLSGDDPVEPGDSNESNIKKYIKAHADAVRRFVQENYNGTVNLWLKEHKSYKPLNSIEKEALRNELIGLNCQVNFVSDYLPIEYRLMPAECILKYCKFTGVIGEPSAILFHSAKAKIKTAAIVSNFCSLRTPDENNRNLEYVRLNALVDNKFMVY